MGDWSTHTVFSSGSMAPNSEDLPEPATPVIAVSVPRGTSTSRSCRLFAAAPRISSTPSPVRHSASALSS